MMLRASDQAASFFQGPKTEKHAEKERNTMSFFENELQKIVCLGVPVSDPKYVGGAFYGNLGANLRLKLQFITQGTHAHYEAIKATVIKRNDGPVDSAVFNLADVIGTPGMKRPTSGTALRPHIWEYNDRLDWYSYHPNAKDYKALCDTVSDYCSVFQTQDMDQGMQMSQQL